MVGGIDSLRWDGDKLVSETKVEFDVLELEPVDFPTLKRSMAIEQGVREGEMIDLSKPIKVFEQTIELRPPIPSLWTRLWCALWWGHRPARVSWWNQDFQRDYITCRCGKVSDSRENVERMTGHLSFR